MRFMVGSSPCTHISAPTSLTHPPFLADETYIVSGARDFYRQQGPFLVEKVADYGNFFSALAHHPAAGARCAAAIHDAFALGAPATFAAAHTGVCLTIQTAVGPVWNPNCAYPRRRVKGSSSVPACVDRAFHERRASPQQRALQSSTAQVSGPQLYKFHRRPLPPVGTDAASARLAAQLAAVRFAPRKPAPAPPPPAPEPPVKEAATQSDYRESEVQTLPWTPAYTLPGQGPGCKQAAVSAARHCSGPELLTLADLKWGDGLPGGWGEGLGQGGLVGGSRLQLNQLPTAHGANLVLFPHRWYFTPLPPPQVASPRCNGSRRRAPSAPLRRPSPRLTTWRGSPCGRP